MPSSTTFLGERTYIPGARVKQDPTGVVTGRAVERRLVLVGEGVGGAPVSYQTNSQGTILRFSSAASARETFLSGDLRDAIIAAFDASADPLVGAPSEVLVAKVNPATRSTLVLKNGATDVVQLYSQDFGSHTSRVSAAIAGVTGGRRVTVSFDGESEAVTIPDSVALSVTGSGDYDTVSGLINATGLDLTFEHAIATDAPANAHTAGEAVEVVSADAYDTVQTVTVYGTDADDDPISESLALNGATTVTGVAAFKTVTAARVDGATRGAITVSDSSDSDTLYVIAAALTANHTAGAAEVVSTSTADRGAVTIIGYKGAVQTQVTLSLNGTTAVSGGDFDKIVSAQLSAAQAGTVTVRAAGAGAVAFTIAPGAVDAGLRLGKGAFIPRVAPINGTLTLAHDAAPIGASFAVVRGVTTAGVVAAEVVDVTEVDAATTNSWSSIEQVEIGQAEAAVNISGRARLYAPTTALTAVASGINGAGLSATLDGASQALTVADLDYLPLDPTPFSATRGVYDLVDWANNVSTLVTATRLGGLFPSNISATFLTGGVDGETDGEDWQAAFDEIQRLRGVVVVVLSEDAAVHAQWRSHSLYMAGTGGDVREGFVALPGTSSLATVQSLVQAINDRNTAAVCQEVQRFAPDGTPTWYGAKVLAAIAGAMFVGARVALPLTRKVPNIINVRQPWSMATDRSAIIKAGAMAVEAVDNVGLRWLRSVTTWVRDDNPIWSETSANGAANSTQRAVQAQLDTLTGLPNTDVAAVLAPMTAGVLDEKVRQGELAAWAGPVNVVAVGDTFNVSVAIAPTEPANFINVTLQLQRYSTGG